MCQSGGCVVVAYTAPAADKADPFNRMERPRDPLMLDRFFCAGRRSTDPVVDLGQIRLGMDRDSFLEMRLGLPPVTLEVEGAEAKRVDSQKRFERVLIVKLEIPPSA